MAVGCEHHFKLSFGPRGNDDCLPQRGHVVYVGRSEQIPAILWDVQQNHPEHLDTVCGIAKIGESRRKELLQVGGGRKAIEQQRAENAARQKRLQDKRKAAVAEQKKADAAAAATKPLVTAPKQSKAGKGKSADKPKPDKPKPATTKSSVDAKSAKALVEFKVACDHWLSQLTDCDKLRAVNYVQVRTGAIPETELMAA